MVSLKIESTFTSYEEAKFTLMHIGKLIELGYRRGDYPYWSIEEVEEIKTPIEVLSIS